MDCMRNGFEEGKLLNGRFLTVAPLNHGSFGMVFSAKDTVTGHDVAIKCITKADAVKDCSTCPATINTDDRSEELAIHSRLSLHPNIVNLISHFETDAHQYMVLELCPNGDLYEAIRVGKGPLQTDHVRAFMLELVDAIEHLHTNGVYHRDIKPENIFLNAAGAMKLGDFGLATTDTWSTEFAVGSDRYMAPEQYASSVYGYGYSPAAADIWAIGIVLLNVLFQRNPFAFPTANDPLFADFAGNRDTLLDVFPAMSRDTYNVLLHCLVVDPANRSLGAVRDALDKAVSFTTDDETLDDFCTDPNEIAPVATAAREPLRTPSITSPNMSGEDFPWTANLLKTPQKATRQLSTIHDEEPDLFPGSATSEGWQYVDTDEASLSSNVDSGLGMSYKSNKSMRSLKSTTSSILPTSNIVGSLPISFMRPKTTSSPYGAHGSGFSKSWSDMLDEEEEMLEQGRSSFDFEYEIDRVTTAQPSTPQLPTPIEDDRGSATPRPALAETDVNARRTASPIRKAVEQSKADAELPKSRSSSILDKWAALGTFRRSKQTSSSGSSTPTGWTPAGGSKAKSSTKYEAFANLTSFGSNKKQKAQATTRERAPSWRQDTSPERLRTNMTNKSQIWDRKDSPTHNTQNWELDNDWRQHKRPATKPPSPIFTPTKLPLTTLHDNDPPPKPQIDFLDTIFPIDTGHHPEDGDLTFGDDGDLEWVSGTREIHI